jgi:hypothetical protein
MEQLYVYLPNITDIMNISVTEVEVKNKINKTEVAYGGG